MTLIAHRSPEADPISPFPGLWIDVDAVLAGKIAKSQRTLNKRLRTPERARFVESLAAKSKSRRGRGKRDA